MEDAVAELGGTMIPFTAVDDLGPIVGFIFDFVAMGIGEDATSPRHMPFLRSKLTVNQKFCGGGWPYLYSGGRRVSTAHYRSKSLLKRLVAPPHLTDNAAKRLVLFMYSPSFSLNFCGSLYS